LQEGTQYEQLRSLRMSRQQSAVTRESATYSTTKPRPVEPIVEKKTAGRKQAQPLDISHADDVHLLSDAEVELCSMLRILPRPYLIIKEQILSVYSRKGVLRKRDARDLVKIDVNKTGRIYDFFIQMGWLKPPATTLTSTVD
jgi:transcriptional adapter 2-alpha